MSTDTSNKTNTRSNTSSMNNKKQEEELFSIPDSNRIYKKWTTLNSELTVDKLIELLEDLDKCYK